jgi:threonine dehydratase
MASGSCVTLDDVREAADRIKGQVRVTPLVNSDNISGLAGCRIYLKLECFQRVKAFKFRGALNKILMLPPGSVCCCCSAGNHSQGVALAASLCGFRSVVFMAETAPSAKVQATRQYGGDVRLVGTSFDEAQAACLEALRVHDDWVFVPPYNDKHVIAGAGTIGLEILNQLPDADTVVVPIGGGGLISGVALAIKAIKPSARVIGVQMASCPSTYKLFYEHLGKEMPDRLPKAAVTPLAEGISVKSPGQLCLAMIYRFVDDVVVVTEDDVAIAIALLAERGKVVAEGAGAVSLAAILAKKFAFRPDEKVVAIISGGNIQLSILSRCIDRALFLRQSRVSLSVVLPYGTVHFSRLLDVFAANRAELVTCLPVPHVNTLANTDKFNVVLDIPSLQALRTIQEECARCGWLCVLGSTASTND